MKTFKQFMNEENAISTAVNQIVNPIRRAVGAKTVDLPPGTKEVDYPELLKTYDTSIRAGFGGSGKKKMAVSSGKIQDRVPETPTRDMPPKPQDSTDLQTQMRLQTKLKKMRGY